MPPTVVAVPTTRKSFCFHLAVVMVTESERGVITTVSALLTAPTVTVSSNVSAELTIGNL